MNLGKIVEFLEKKGPLLGIALILVLGGYFIWHKFGPILPGGPLAPKKVPEPQFISQRNVPSVSLKAIVPRERTLPVFLFREKSLTPNRLWALARNFGFEGEPQISQDARWGTMYHWSEDGKTLTTRANGEYFSFSYDFPAENLTTFGDFSTPEEAKNIVWAFLEKEGLDSPLLSLATEKTSALKLTGARPSVTSLDQADVLEIHFRAQVEGYPLPAEEGSTADPVLAWIDRGGKILKLDYYSLGEIGEKVGDYPLKSSAEVEEDLKAGKAVLVRSEAEKAETLRGLTTITQTSLAYFKVADSQIYLQPILVLKGWGDLTSGERAKITLYLPAISNVFFEAN